MPLLTASEQSQTYGPQDEQQQGTLGVINEVPIEAQKEAPNEHLQRGRFKPPIHFIGPAGPKLKHQTFWQRLITYGLRPGGKSPVFYTKDNESIVNLAGLQRLNLHVLQMKLIEKTAELIRHEQANDKQMDEINDAMTKYGKPASDIYLTNVYSSRGAEHRLRSCGHIRWLINHGTIVAALRDWDYMVECNKNAGTETWRDPFILTTEKTLDMCLMDDAGIILTHGEVGKAPLDLARPNLPGDGRGSLNQGLEIKMFWKRFSIAIFGSIALLGPMLLMVLHKSLATTLATACVSVVLFALAVAYFLDESLGTVVSIVAAYTAVIVVFVGTSS